MTSRDFAALRAELGLPPAALTDRFPERVLAEARTLSQQSPRATVDLTDVPFVTVDPPGSMDLDQAVHIARLDDGGFRVQYAIADLGSAIAADGAVDAEARQRGQTLYLPDGRVPLHPPVLSEGSLSLLPDQTRGAAVWSIDVAPDGSVTSATVERALVRSVARLEYEGVQRDADAGTPHASIEALGDLGLLRRQVRLNAGAIDLALPEQGVVRSGEEWTLRIEPRTEADTWNAEVSLLTGMAAAEMMLASGIGLLRTLPAPSSESVEAFLEVARRLGVDVRDGETPGEVLAALDASTPVAMALMTHATRLLRGAGYVAFDGTEPETREHAGIGGAYAHVTAPLRRLVDRFTTEVCLALSADVSVPEWARAALPEIAEAMRASGRLAASADREAIDAVEAWVMADRHGETFEAIVLRAGRKGSADGAEIMIVDPPVEAWCTGAGLVEGSTIQVSVEQVDETEGSLQYRPV
ncbi:RNB domain-containing ribonuclease [Aeromicrobium sp. CF3.5]|uniref:RNB domain-containing ribonuclease n=1 Tax=Aeromicrobium sp. CF3.5 TaxID=3373078 RepID=UPI003EE64B84